MSMHKKLIYVTLGIAITLSTFCYFIYRSEEFIQQDWLTVLFWILVGVVGSDIVVLICEILNYQDSKKRVVFEFCAESIRITEQLKKLRFCLTEYRGNYEEIRKVLIELSDLNTFPLVFIRSNIDFLNPRTKAITYIDDVWLTITSFTDSIDISKEYFLYSKFDPMIKVSIDTVIENFEKSKDVSPDSQHPRDIVELIEDANKSILIELFGPLPE